MSIELRVLLLIVSIFMVIFVLRKIRKAKLKIEYSLFWIIFSMLLLIISIFPQIAIYISGLLGIISPVNFIFLFIIFIVIMNNFYLTLKCSNTERMIQSLTQEIAIRTRLSEEEHEDE